jgi:hypothetical protein
MRVLLVAMLCGCIAGTALPGRGAAADGVVLPLPAADQQEINAQLGPGVVGPALPSKPIDDPLLYFPLQERTLGYQITAGAHAGTNQTMRVEKGKRPNGRPAWRFGLTPSIEGFIQQTPGGDLIMPAVSDSEEGVLVVTTPPNPFVLKGMQPGESRALSQTVAVNYLDDPTSRDYSGTLKATYTYVGTYQVTVPAGTYAAILLRLDYAGKIGPAHTQDTTYYFFAPGVGLVALISQEDVEAFWIVHIDTTTGKVLGSD